MSEHVPGDRVARAERKRKRVAAARDPSSSAKKRTVHCVHPSLYKTVSPEMSIEPRKPGNPRVKRKTKRGAKMFAVGGNSEPARSEKREDFNAGDSSQMDRPYATHIYDYLQRMEVDPKRRPLPDYMEKVQTDVSANMRGVLVDWLVEVADEYKLLPETLYLAISYIDRFLSTNTLRRQRLQLLGVASMFIASKYEEITPPHLEDFCYVTDNTYTKNEVIKMEHDVLKCLNFEVSNPTVKIFLRRLHGVAQEGHQTSDEKLECLSYYLAELSLLDYACVKFLPSMVAASVIFLARYMIYPEVQPWNSALQQYSGYSPNDMNECVRLLHELCRGRRGGSLCAVREKYKQHKFRCVANIASPPEIPPFHFEDVRR
ncbi:hypothetical protein SAY86_004156 [Trapa natans]|uniref:Cyclin N-terminal domain-containing protein n=1 Tax=Trapa natans TaxID=22666 RepID=A0AAN7MF66_TRANT|nr:hypothetical protein SAY86_004156 [Trapa natans]